MTDNERAATFIGWRTGRERCVSCGKRPDELPQTRGHSFIPDSAPDMSDPRNYMKALDGLECELCRGAANEWAIEILTNAGWVDGNDRDCGKAAVTALAALYDAEVSK